MLNIKKILVVIILINNLSSNCASFKLSKKRINLTTSPKLDGYIEPSSTPIHNEEEIASPSKRICSIETGLTIDTAIKTDFTTNASTHELLTCPSSSSPQFLKTDLIALMQAESPKNTNISSASFLSPKKTKRPDHLSIKTEKSPIIAVEKISEDDQSPKSATLCLALDLLLGTNIEGDNTLNIVRQNITPLSTPITSPTELANPFSRPKTKRSKIEIGEGLYLAMLKSPKISPEVAGFLKSPNVLQRKAR